MAVVPPTPPTKPTPPSVDGKDAAPIVNVESSGVPVLPGELHTSAEKFGIHIRLSGSEAPQQVQPQDEEAVEAEPVSMTVEEKIKADAKADRKPTAVQSVIAQQQAKETASPIPKANQEKEPDQKNTNDEQAFPLGIDGVGNADIGNQEEAKEGTIKVMPQDDGSWYDQYGDLGYWPFLLVFAVALASFVAINFMNKRKKNEAFSGLSYKQKLAGQAYAEAKPSEKKNEAQKPVAAVRSTKVASKDNKDSKTHFEIRI